MTDMKGNLSEWEAAVKAAGYLGEHGVPDFKDIETKSLKEQGELLKNESIWTGADNFGGKDGMVLFAGPNYDVLVLQRDGTVISGEDKDIITIKALTQDGDQSIRDCEDHELLPIMALVYEEVLKDPVFHGQKHIHLLETYNNGEFADFMNDYNRLAEYVDSCLADKGDICICNCEGQIVADANFDEILACRVCVCPVANVSQFVHVEKHLVSDHPYSVKRYLEAEASFGKGETSFIASLPEAVDTSLVLLDGDSYRYASRSFDVLSMQMNDKKNTKSEDFER